MKEDYLIYNKILLESIENEKVGTDYNCPEEDRPILREMMNEINACIGTNINYLAEIDAFDLHGAGPIMVKYITKFSSESVKGFLIPQIVSDKIKDADRLILQLYLNFRLSDEYVIKQGGSSSAHIYVRYDNAFRKLKPKRLAKDLLELASHPRDAFYLPFTMRMLASWKLSEMKDLLILYSKSDCFTAQEVGFVYGESDKLLEFMKRELTFTAIDGLQYYPSKEAIDVIKSFASSKDNDIRSAAKKTLKKMTK